MEYRIIGIHDGDIHLDESMATAVLRIHNPTLEVKRTRDMKILSKLDARVDVGRKYCLETNDFDHHQEGGAGQRENGVPYASAGLIWKHFGRELCDNDEAWGYVDKRLIQYVDSGDAGLKSDGETYGLAKIIRRLNLRRNTGKSTIEESFDEALKLSGLVLENEILAANEQVKSNIETRASLKNFKGLPYIVLKRDTGWEEVLVPEKDKLYVIYQAPDRNWRVRAIPTIVDVFKYKKLFPEAWRGKSEELVKITGIEDFLFCHLTGFTAVTKTLNSAVKIAKIAASL